MSHGQGEDSGAVIDYSTARGRDYPSVRQFNVFVENRVGNLLAVVRRWRGRGQVVYWVVPSGTRFPTPPGVRFVPAGLFTFEAPQLERPVDRLPREADALRFDLQLYRVELAPEDAR